MQPGQQVLINGASGGVGTFAVQLAKSLRRGGDRASAARTTSSSSRSLGADHVVDYTQEDFTHSGERHDLMLDVAGSRPFRQFRRVLTPDATVVAGRRPDLPIAGLGPLKHLAGTRLTALGRSQQGQSTSSRRSTRRTSR